MTIEAGFVKSPPDSSGEVKWSSKTVIPRLPEPHASACAVPRDSGFESPEDLKISQAAGCRACVRRWMHYRAATVRERWKPVRFLMGAARKGLVLAALAVSARAARADQIIAMGTNYPGATIDHLDDGQLVFQTGDGEEVSVWLSDIDRLTVDATGMFADFNQAERYLADKNPAQAIVRYRRTLRRAEGMWVDLITARLVTACDRAGRIDQAVRYLIRVVRGMRVGPALAVRLIPRTVPQERGAKAVQAIDRLDEAIAGTPDPDARIPLQLCLYEIMRHIGHQRTSEVARAAASLVIPEALRCRRVYAILLPALTQRLDAHVDAEALAGLDRAILYSPDDLLPSFLLLKGNALLRSASTRDDRIRAAWPFMRVAIHMPRDPRAAEGLYGAALAVEQIGRKNKAIELLTECLARKHIGDKTRQLAHEALARLRPDKRAAP